jgi:hypothetical protein
MDSAFLLLFYGVALEQIEGVYGPEVDEDENRDGRYVPK